MFLSADYVRWLEKLPCNRHARRRQQNHGQWLDGWVPESINRVEDSLAVNPLSNLADIF